MLRAVIDTAGDMEAYWQVRSAHATKPASRVVERDRRGHMCLFTYGVSNLLFPRLLQRWRDGHWWWLVTAHETVFAGPEYKNQTCRRARREGLIG